MDKQYDTYAYDEAQSVKKRGIISIFQKGVIVVSNSVVTLITID